MTTLGDLGDDPGNFPAPFVWVAGIDNLSGEFLADRGFVESKVTEAATEEEEFPRSLALGGIAPLADHQADLIGFSDLVVVAGSGNCLSKLLQSIRYWVGEGGGGDIFRWVRNQVAVDEDQWVDFHPREFPPE